jgi:hypothetical protein
VRAFSYFHHLANAAEDLHARGVEPEEGSIAVALQRLRAAHVPTKKIISFFERAARGAGADRAPDRGTAQRARSIAIVPSSICWRRGANGRRRTSSAPCGARSC